MANVSVTKLGEVKPGSVPREGRCPVRRSRSGKTEVRPSVRTILAALSFLFLIHGTRVRGDAGTAGSSGPGGQMANVSVTKLGEVKPGRFGGKEWNVKIDPKPIVLWAGAQPASVLNYHLQANPEAGVVEQRFARVDEGPQGLVSAATVRAKLPAGATNDDALDIADPRHVLTGDVDGDGVDELVLVRELGGVEVYRGKKELFKYPSSRPLVATYAPASWHKARLPGRDVLFILFKRKEHEQLDGEHGEKKLARLGLSDLHRLVRVDQRGIAQVKLAGLAPGTEVFSVGPSAGQARRTWTS
jgi:hypothetical protein